MPTRNEGVKPHAKVIEAWQATKVARAEAEKKLVNADSETADLLLAEAEYKKAMAEANIPFYKAVVEHHGPEVRIGDTYDNFSLYLLVKT